MRGWIALVAVVLAVNILMVTLAFVTSPGLVVEDYYERGRAMEEAIRSRADVADDRMLAVDIPADLTAGQGAMLRFFVVDKAGQPVRPDAVTLFAYRPSDAGQDFSLPMIEEAPGRYRAEVSFPLPGLWDSLVEVTEGEAIYRLDERLHVKAR
ncbi:FixH family protein [Thiorhodovibrio winogradskyi]|uniref:FixH family protein n=1 Tax=Thiorhodovibrio winogradskyi TaxID=77007 RepID=UPI002E2CB02E|nr:FixH family protein [Thiorhodovibrio winogradskyi]